MRAGHRMAAEDAVATALSRGASAIMFDPIECGLYEAIARDYRARGWRAVVSESSQEEVPGSAMVLFLRPTTCEARRERGALKAARRGAGEVGRGLSSSAEVAA